jgi:hypothetical protein
MQNNELLILFGGVITLFSPATTLKCLHSVQTDLFMEYVYLNKYIIFY